MMLDVWEVTSGTLSRQNSFDCIVFFFKDNRFCWDECLTLHLVWHADETGPHRLSAGSGGFFKHIGTVVLLCVDFLGVALYITHNRQSA